jgi:hypothetical protein
VAAATAAHHVLVHFFPASTEALDAHYDAWLSGVPAGAGRDHGVRVGQDAAEAFIASRDGDGRDAQVEPAPGSDAPGPGTWVPTGGAAFLAPWLGFVRPLFLTSPTQFATDGPDALGSPAYAADFQEVKEKGAATGSTRTADEEATALFFSDNPIRQYQDAMRDRAVRHESDIVATATMFAAANGAGADALIACWRTKWQHNFWRPDAAIHEAEHDGNPATTPDPAWATLRPNPPYPDYASGHACVSSAVANSLEELFGGGRLDVDILSAPPGLPVTARHYDSAGPWLDEAGNARVWLGIHFRDAIDDGRDLGARVSEYVVDRWFDDEI